MKTTRNRKAQGSSFLAKKYNLTLDTSSGIDDIKIKQYTLLTERDILSKAETLKTEENNAKDEEINMLNEKIHNLMIRNYDLDMAIEKENELRNKCEQEKIRIANYCNDIKEKFKNVDGTIKNYEETIKSMKEENERLAEEYDLKIDDLEQKNNKIVKRIENRIDLFENQKKQIIDGENKVNSLLHEIEEQKNTFKERAMINKIKFDELEKKFANLQKKIYEMQMKFEIKKAESVQNFRKVDIVAEEKQNTEKEIKKFEKENEHLMKEISEMQQHWKRLTSIDIDSKKGKGRRQFTSGFILSKTSNKRNSIKHYM